VLTVNTLPAAPAQQPSEFTVLIVDDSPVNLRLIVQTLHGQGYRLLAARSGSAALDIAARTRPDLILLDVMMPDQDGFEVCSALKAHPATRESVIIFLSALGEVADKVAGLELGASDYITKPIQAEEVLARVANHLTRLRLEREVRRGRDALERELASAARMQRLLLPAALPTEEGISFAAHYQTSRYAGGDYYDVLPLPDGRYGLVVADVSGHGASAAIVMAMIRAVLHALPRETFDPASVIVRLNEHFEYLWETPMYATALCAVVDPRARRLTLAGAGHPQPLLSRAGKVESIDCPNGLPILMMPMPPPQTAVHELHPGDRLLFYTDGITERLGPGDAMYEEERLRCAFARAAFQPVASIVPHIVADVQLFAGGVEAHDDQTLLLVAID
jgi:sigma-B regulation protein RsbU (phosphoserine phosphatase)